MMGRGLKESRQAYVVINRAGKLCRAVCSDMLSPGRNMEKSATREWFENVLGWARAISGKLGQACK